MNRRIWHIPLLFALCCLVVLVAMGWMTTLVVRLDRQDAEAQRRAEREEDSRLALWRMDSALAPVVSQEAARPYFHFTSLDPVIAGYTSKLESVQGGQLLTPSPLRHLTPPVSF